MKLNQISASDRVTQEIVSLVTKNSTLLRNHIEFFKGPGIGTSERKSNPDSTAPTGRTLGSDYTPQVLSPTFIPAGRKMYGATVRVDIAYEKMGYDIASELASQLKTKVVPFVFSFQNLLINGDASVDAKQFNGLKKLCLPSQKIIAAPNGHLVSLGNQGTEKASQQKFLELLETTIVTARGMNKIIVCGAVTFSRLNSIAREYIQWTKDGFGQPIASYNSIPIVNIEELGGNILPRTETVGTSTDCTSLYVVSFGERENMSFFSTQEGFSVYPVQRVGNFLESTIECIMDSILLNDCAVSRLEGLRFL